MIFHDRVIVHLGERGEDDLGNTVWTWGDPHEVPAEVWPLDTSTSIQQGAETVTSRFRIALKAGIVDIPPVPGMLKLSWGAFQFNGSDPTSGMDVDGAVEPHYFRGRLHHYELTSADVA